MVEQFNFENLKIEIPNPYQFELSEKERIEKYQHLADNLKKTKAETLENSSTKYTALMQFFDWLELITPNKKYVHIKDRIVESAKCFTDCIANFDPLKAEDTDYFNKWNENQKFWHAEIENSITRDLPKIIQREGQDPENNSDEIKQLIHQPHTFFNNFALFVACKQTVWKDLSSGDNERERVLVEK